MEKETISESLIWSSLSASAIKRFLAHAAEHLLEVAISTRKAAMPSAYELPELFRSLRHGDGPWYRLAFDAMIAYLGKNAKRAHPKRDSRTGRSRLGLKPMCQRDCSKDTGLHSSCPRLMQDLKGLLTPFALGFSPHVECNSCLYLLVSAHTVNTFLHFAITTIASFDRIRGRGQQVVIKKGQGFLQGWRIELLQRLAQMLEPVEALPPFGELIERRLRPAPSIEQGIDLLHELTQLAQRR